MNKPQGLPKRAGVSLKPVHYDTILSDKPDVGWFEVHAENYMGGGGPAHHYLEKVRSDYPLSVHGVGLSIGSDGPLDQSHLQRLKVVVDRYEPEMFSEHLAWSTHAGMFFNDLLPLPYTPEAVSRVSEHIEQVQETLGRRMLLENPATYVLFENSSLEETEFLARVVERTGCGLLLDVNNVYVSAINHDYEPLAYINAFPLEHVEEIHLGGHAPDEDQNGRNLLVDTHDRQVADAVWQLYDKTLQRIGVLPTLIEWDNHVPDWPTLLDQAVSAERVLARHRRIEHETRSSHAVAG